MFLGVLNTIFVNISNYLPHLELRNHSIQIVVITNFVVILIVGIKRFDCVCVCDIIRYGARKRCMSVCKFEIYKLLTLLYFTGMSMDQPTENGT